MSSDPSTVKTPATRDRGYMPQLDALRFFAVLGVVIIHNWQPSPHTFLVGWFNWGTLGVKLFFVLSGFLITGILIGGRELARDSRGRLFFMRQFYARRFLRIFPVYYAVLFLLLIAGVGQIRQIWLWLFGYATNIYVWHHLAYPYAVPHFWTLAIEEQFYLVWPFVLLFLPRRWLMPFLLALCCLGPAWRLWASFHYAPHDWNAAYTATPGNVDFLAIGAILALVAHADRDRGRLQRTLARVLLPVGLVTYGVLYWLDDSYDHHASLALQYTSAALVFCWLIGGASLGFGGRAGRLLEWRPIVYLGKISYGIYIYHFLVPVAIHAAAVHLGRHYTDSGFPNFVVTSLITFVIAALSWELFERPINGLKRHIRYERVATSLLAEEPVTAASTRAVS